jgi:hypothetical protein
VTNFWDDEEDERIDFIILPFLPMKTFIQQRHLTTTNIPIRMRAVCKKSYSLVPLTLKSIPFYNKGVAAYNNNNSEKCTYRQHLLSNMSARLFSSNSSSNKRNPNLYDILKVSKTATQKEIKLAYFREVHAPPFSTLLYRIFRIV